jgi:hypothetical protein
MRRTVLVLLAVALLAPSAQAKRRRVNQLLRVVTPTNHGTAPAHPFVNVVVRFGSAGKVAADPATFRASIGRRDITSLFAPETDAAGALIGMRAKLDRSLLHLGRHANRLRFVVESRATGKGRPLRDIDRLRFRAVDAPDGRPVAHLLAGSSVILPGVPITFDGSQSSDPDADTLSYHWDFGDGTTSSERSPTHVYAAGTPSVDVTLTVSDGVLTSLPDRVALSAALATDPGRTPGSLQLTAPDTLEFGAVAPGTSATRTLVVRNTDTAATSQLKVELAASSPAFTVTPVVVDLAAGAQQTVTVTFAPASEGHQAATITALASASNAPVVEVLAHGFGGSAPATGPTLAASTLFYLTFLGAPRGIFPDGRRFTIDNTVGLCQGTGDPCVVGTDCASRTCLPGNGATFDPVDFCTDGRNVYLLSDSVFTDPSNSNLLVGVLALALDGNGARTGANILYRTTDSTTQIACDRTPGGSIYLAEYHDLNLPQRCFRTAQENLVAVNRSTGAATTLLRQLDGVEGLDPCDDDLDPANDLEVATTRNGPVVYADFDGGFDTGGGVYRAWPSALPLSPDITDFFQVHPDGSVLYVTATDPAPGQACPGPTGLLSVYKISPQQAATGAPSLVDLTPCATVEVPNNFGRTYLDTDAGSFAFAPGPGGGTLLVSFLTSGTGVPYRSRTDCSRPAGASPALPTALQVQGTVAIDVPAGSGACTVRGFVNLEFLDSMRF